VWATGMNHLQINDVTFDYLIDRSGIIGKRILKLCRFIHKKDEYKFDRTTGFAGFWLRQGWLRRVIKVRTISWLLNVFYTYYIGGSLTRSDQLTFARLHGMDGSAYRLTLFNAIFCGVPCALGYFLLGEGFSLLQGIHSYAQLPSLLAKHTSLGFGFTSFAVDIFRAGDSLWHKRCWAPFGFIPLAINIPTYLKRLFQGSKAGDEEKLKTKTLTFPAENICRSKENGYGATGSGTGSQGVPSKDFSKTCRVIPHSR